MVPHQKQGPETVEQEWESGVSRDWEEPGEFLAGMRRKSRTGMESFFLGQRELKEIIEGSKNGSGTTETQGCDAEEE